MKENNMAEIETNLSEKDKHFREFALNGNMWRVVAYVSLPLMAYQGFMNIFKILDTIMASHISTDAVSSIAYISQISYLISAVGTVYLGRPWRNHAKTVLLNCELGAHIHPAAFHDWGKTEARETLFYALNGCYGEGFCPNALAEFVTLLPDEEAKRQQEFFDEIAAAFR